MMRSSSSKSALLQEELCGLAKEARWLDALEKLESYDDIASLDATLVSEIREFGGEFRRAQRECADASIEWEEGHSYLGTETKFRYDDGGVLWLSTEGSMEEVSAYHAVSVIREVALFGEWVPMIRWVNVVEALDFSRLCTFFAVGVRGVLVRDCVLRCAACDASRRDGCLYFAGSSPEDAETYFGRELPPRTWGLGFDRMYVKALHARIEFLSPTSQRCKIVAAVDLRIRLPRSLLDFLMKRLVGVFLLLWRRQARYLANHPESPHRRKINDDTAFYQDWLWPKYLAFLKTKGWKLPQENAVDKENPTIETKEERLLNDDDDPGKNHMTDNIPPR